MATLLRIFNVLNSLHFQNVLIYKFGKGVVGLYWHENPSISIYKMQSRASISPFSNALRYLKAYRPSSRSASDVSF